MLNFNIKNYSATAHSYPQDHKQHKACSSVPFTMAQTIRVFLAKQVFAIQTSDLQIRNKLALKTWLGVQKK